MLCTASQSNKTDNIIAEKASEKTQSNRTKAEIEAALAALNKQEAEKKAEIAEAEEKILYLDTEIKMAEETIADASEARAMFEAELSKTKADVQGRIARNRLTLQAELVKCNQG